ncbi:hypothetical protein GDO81_023250 [Engystomops pustulosus]|uniref:Uncharacterized protein n=1 Tax=Engystomops pustulosus TaxID=76066 RepID=A0AAV6Z3B0_ENGPU|nr:hypothetical protein GDO81_023250 [Engystomops pustulosus]
MSGGFLSSVLYLLTDPHRLWLPLVSVLLALAVFLGVLLLLGYLTRKTSLKMKDGASQDLDRPKPKGTSPGVYLSGALYSIYDTELL